MRSAAPTALLVALALTAAVPAGAEAAISRMVCAPTAVLRDSPKGFVIGRLSRHQRVQMHRRSANRRWALVVSRGGTVGWVPVTSLCRA